MKTFFEFLNESEPIKPVQPIENIANKLPPKKTTTKKSKFIKKSEKNPTENKKDTFESSPPLGFKPYTKK